MAFFKLVELSHFKTTRPFWPTVMVALVAASMVCIIEPCFPMRRGIFVGEILTSSPESIFPKFSPLIVINGSLPGFTLTILPTIRSPVFSFEESSSLEGE